VSHESLGGIRARGWPREVTVQVPSSSDRQRGQGTLLGRAVLAFWSDVAPDHEDGFNDWYTNEHLPERVSVPGFFRGRRYVRTGDSRAVQKYFTLYETESLATLSSAPYLERLDNPTPWTQKMVPLFLNSNRVAYAIGASIGGGIGGWMATVEFGPQPDAADELRSWLAQRTLPSLLDEPDVTGCALGEADLDTTSAKDGTAEGRDADGGSEVAASWILFVEGARSSVVDIAEASLLGPDGLSQHGALEEVALKPYRLMFSLADRPI
jgi:hypothetical protein